jgi:hypothetical protein
MRRVSAILLAIALTASVARADVIHLKNGGTLEGVILKNDRDGMTVLLKYATVTLESFEVESIEKPAPDALAKGPRIADWKVCFRALASRPWGPDLHPLSAPIIDSGDLKNVPYVIHASEDYQFVLYGDPDAPARVELGLSGVLLTQDQARRECVELASSFLRDLEDAKILRALDPKGGKQEREGLSFEIDQEPDSRGRETWWVSLSDGRALDAARVSDKQLATLAMSDPPPAPRNPTLVEKAKGKGETQEVISPFGTEPHNPHPKRKRSYGGGGHWGRHVRWSHGRPVTGPLR